MSTNIWLRCVFSLDALNLTEAVFDTHCDAFETLIKFAQDFVGVVVGSVANVVGISVCLLQDACAFEVSRTQQPLFPHLLSYLLLIVHGHVEGVERMTHTVDELKELLLIDDDHRREGQPARLVDDVFEFVDEVVEWHNYDPP